MPETPGRSPGARVSPDVLPLVGLAALGTVLGIIRLGSKSLWIDESSTLAFAELPWRSFWEPVEREAANMGLYYVALRGWVATFGDGVAAVRSLSVLGAVASLPLAFLAGRKLVGRHAALAGAFLLAANAFFVRYAQELRGYSFLVMLSCASTLAFIRCVEKPSTRSAVLYGLAVAAGLYIHFLSIFLVVAHVVSLAALPSTRRPWRTLVRAGGLTAVLALPLAVLMQTADHSDIDWIEPLSASQIRKLALDLTSAGGDAPLSVLSIVALGLYATCAVVGLVAAVRVTRRGRSDAAWRRALVVSWALVPPAVGIALSVLKPLMTNRYYIGALPGLTLLVAAGLLHFAPRWRVALAVGLAVCAAAALVRWYDEPSFEAWEDAVATVESRAGADDALVLYPPALSVSFRYYAERSDLDPGRIVFPSEARALYPPTKPADVIAALDESAPARFWLVSSADSAQELPPLRRGLSEDYRLVDDWSGERVTAELYERTS
jgi:mannosyltransferase